MYLALHFDGADMDPVRCEERVLDALAMLPEGRVHVRVRHGSLLYGHVAHLGDKVARAAIATDDQPRWAAAERVAAIADRHPWVVTVEGLSHADARRVADRVAAREPDYVGAILVDIGSRVHWTLYRRSLPLAYRVFQRQLRVLYPLTDYPDSTHPVGGPDDQRDHEIAEHWKQLGIFASVEWESTALEDTVFDEIHTFDHARRAAAVEVVLGSEFSFLIADALTRCAAIDTDLETTLHAAVGAFEGASTTEHLAHVGLSCRRFLERLADALFPARAQLRKGRKVGKAEYRNRLWAWVDESLGETSGRVVLANLDDLCSRLDRIDDLANKGLHASIDRAEGRRLLVNLVTVAWDLLSIAPPPLAAPLGPYAGPVNSFAERVARGDGS